jgi:UPF0716 protein FxsA
MFYKLLLIFIGIPTIEMLILIKLGEMLGFFNTVMLIVVTGLLGSVLARIQGARAIINIQSALAAGQMPAEEIIDAFLIFVAGILLITPGLLTDIAGFLLLIPTTRNALKRWMRRKIDEAFLRASGNGRGADFRIFIR